MKIELTETLRMALRDAITKQSPKMTFAEFGERMGYKRSWATKVLNSSPDSIGYIDRSDLAKAEEILNSQFLTAEESEDFIPDFIRELARSASSNPHLTAALAALAEIAKPKVIYSVPTLHQKALTKLGAAITKIVHEWEEPEDPHYSKIGLEVVEEIRKTLASMFPVGRKSP